MTVLFVSSCSLTKAVGGTAAFDEGDGIASVATDHAQRLLDRREEVRQLVKDRDTVDWQGVLLKDLDYNTGLVRGREFGGSKTASYMPAVDRYQGRFYLALGDAGRALCKSRGNTLLLSGLYGLVRASEPIQLYSCPLSAEVAAVWKRDGLLTDLLRACIRSRGVLRVFDLTAMAAYRGLIDWDRVVGDGTEVLHCFDAMAAGDNALTSFGRHLQYLLSLSEDELAGLSAYGRQEHPSTCVLHRSAEPPPDFPAETWLPHQAVEVIAGGNPSGTPWRFATSSRFNRDADGNLEEVLQAVADICNAPITPRGDTVKPLVSRGQRLWRYRLGKKRLVYEPDPERRVVRLVRFGPRDKIYADL